jgi:hypothetical protein
MHAIWAFNKDTLNKRTSLPSEKCCNYAVLGSYFPTRLPPAEGTEPAQWTSILSGSAFSAVLANPLLGGWPELGSQGGKGMWAVMVYHGLNFENP